MMNNEQAKSWTWVRHVPFTKEHKLWKKELNNREIEIDTKTLTQSETKIYMVRRKQHALINTASLTLIFVISSLWSVLPHFFELKGNLNWINLGFHGSNLSWLEDIGLFVIPGSACGVVHKIPNLVSNKKAKLLANIVIKIIPFIIIAYWFMKHQKSIKQIKLEDLNEQKLKSVTGEDQT